MFVGGAPSVCVLGEHLLYVVWVTRGDIRQSPSGLLAYEPVAAGQTRQQPGQQIAVQQHLCMKIRGERVLD
jgi:hypothetical protein